jgi:uncharacterized coiled-coil protein SlyX
MKNMDKMQDHIEQMIADIEAASDAMSEAVNWMLANEQQIPEELKARLRNFVGRLKASTRGSEKVH